MPPAGQTKPAAWQGACVPGASPLAPGNCGFPGGAAATARCPGNRKGANTDADADAATGTGTPAPTPACAAAGFDDRAWRTLDLPHDWSIEDLPAREDDAECESPQAHHTPGW